MPYIRINILYCCFSFWLTSLCVIGSSFVHFIRTDLNEFFLIAEAESEEELKSLLIKVKVESEKVVLKLNIQKTKIMASRPITSLEIDGETVETVSDFIFGGSKITTDGDCSHEIKRQSLEGKLWPT